MVLCAYCKKETGKKLWPKCKRGYCDRTCMAKWRQENGTWNKGKKWEEMYSKEVYDKLDKRNRSKGAENHNWKRKRPDLSERNRKNINPVLNKYYAYQRNAFEIYGRKCSQCGKEKGQIDVHHIDGNHNNNDVLNLLVLCASCHGKLHKSVKRI